MLPDRNEIVRSLTGAWRVLLDQPDAFRHFDVSVDGFWRSFGAIVLIIPSYALMVLAEYRAILSDAVPDDGLNGGAFFLDSVVVLGLDWVALPVILALLARRLGITRTYTAFVVARNWCAVVVYTLAGGIALLELAGLFGPDLGRLLLLVALIVAIRYMFLIARRTLHAGIALAVGIVVLDYATSVTLVVVVDWLAGV